VLFGGAVRLRAAAVGASNAWRAWRVARAGDEIMAAAQAGGRHAGFLANYAGRSATEIGRAARSLGRHIAKHEEYLKDPASKVKNWGELAARQQQHLIDGWQAEIRTAREQVEILNRIP
jgi:hypothetical protein